MEAVRCSGVWVLLVGDNNSSSDAVDTSVDTCSCTDNGGNGKIVGS